MNCGFAQMVSTMIDGELSETEVAEIGMHIAGCTDCQALERDFLLFREQLRTPAPDLAKRPAMPLAKRPSIWKKGIFVPVPVFAAFLLLVAGMLIGLVALRSGKTDQIALENPLRNSQSTLDPAGELSISRFDKGGRAEIYIEPKQAPGVTR